jgi:hypothetical protein
MHLYKSAEWYEQVHALFTQSIGIHEVLETGVLPAPSPAVCSPSPAVGQSTSPEVRQSTAPPESAEPPAVVVDSEVVATTVEPVHVVFRSTLPLFADPGTSLGSHAYCVCGIQVHSLA